MTFDVTTVIVAVIGLLSAVLTAVAVPWVRAKIGTARWEQLVSVAQVAVSAAEQLYPGGKGEDKLDYALKRVNAALSEQGMRFDEQTVRAAVEAMVRALYPHAAP